MAGERSDYLGYDDGCTVAGDAAVEYRPTFRAMARSSRGEMSTCPHSATLH
jgi:hypothetical protein